MLVRSAMLAVGAFALALAATPAEAAKKKSAKSSGLMTQSAASQDAATEKLNQQSLNMAKSGQNALSGQADTTANLNAMSQGAAAAGRNMGGAAPIPFK